MSTQSSDRRSQSKRQKPKKPHADYPLYPHAAGVWAKKVRGRVHYFGPWSDPQAALEKWLDQKDDLLAGRKPRERDPDSITVKTLCDLFLESRERRVASGELARRSFDDYLDTARRVADHLGRRTGVEDLRPDDFAKLRSELAKGVNLKTLEGRIARARAIFNHADKNGLIERSLSKLWGTEFAKPSRTALTKLSNQTTRLFTRQEILDLIAASDGQVHAMIWLGINGALGPTDCALIRQGDVEGGWLTLPRSKTGKPRRIPLWAETLQAIARASETRPKAKDDADADLLFITKYGRSWLPEKRAYPLSAEFAKLRKRVGITGKGKGFYSLRHTFQTIGDECRDFVAVSSIMGHAGTSISDHYRERIGDDRLRAVVDHVRCWLLGEGERS